jgi:hypothetical protein
MCHRLHAIRKCGTEPTRKPGFGPHDFLPGEPIRDRLNPYIVFD